MKHYSRLVKEHLKKRSVAEQYLLDTPFTLKDLHDIATSRVSNLGPSYYVSKPKMVDNSPSYASYLEKAGIVVKPPINISSFYR